MSTGAAHPAKETARAAAVRVLAAVRREGSYSNIALDNLLESASLSAADTALATRLVYGVIERQITLDWCLSACSNRPLKKLHPLVVDSLRVAAYQLLYMERIPASAAVNEAVNLVKRRQPYAAGYVNGVLHTLIRQKDELFSSFPAGDAGLSVRYSCPEALIAFWRKAYGEAILHELLESLNDSPPTYLRVNTLQVSVEDFVKILADEGVECRVFDDLPACVEVSSAAAVKRLAKIRQNWYYHQDMASQYCCLALGAQPDERVADVCAAPGGKTLTIAQAMQNRGEILSGDIYPAKCDALTARAERLGATIVRTVCRDASTPPPAALVGTFDRVVCDAPCSGLGVIRRKPEIRYKDPAAFADLPELQFRILEQAATLVRSGGVLQYSTCTLNPAENRAVAERFLAKHPEFSPRPLDGMPPSVLGEPAWCRTLFPANHRTDGFFVAGFVKEVDV